MINNERSFINPNVILVKLDHQQHKEVQLVQSRRHITHAQQHNYFENSIGFKTKNRSTEMIPCCPPPKKKKKLWFDKNSVCIYRIYLRIAKSDNLQLTPRRDITAAVQLKTWISKSAPIFYSIICFPFDTARQKEYRAHTHKRWKEKTPNRSTRLLSFICYSIRMGFEKNEIIRWVKTNKEMKLLEFVACQKGRKSRHGFELSTY